MTTDAAPFVDSVLEISLRDIGIPPRPLILERFRIEMQQDEPDFNRIAGLVSSDVALAAGLISTANSSFFGLPSFVSSVREALMVLGLDVASRAIACVMLRKTFPHSQHLERFWDASARIARTSGWLAQRYTQNRLNPDEAYTFGLFRDCGIAILEARIPGYEGILNEANHDATRNFTAVEKMHLPTNHAMVGSLLAQSWWLPDEISLAIRDHHDVSAIESPSAKFPQSSCCQIAVAQFAEYLLQQHTGLSYTEEWSKLGPACLRVLGIDEADVKDILIEAIPVIQSEE